MSANYTGGTVAPSERPNPLSKAASSVGVAWSGVSGLVSALVAFGALTAAQGDAVTAAGESAQGTVTALGTVLAGVLPLIAGIVAAFRTTAAARDQVTPVADPRNDAGQPLTPDNVIHGSVERTTMADKRPGVVTDGDTWTS